MSKNILSMGQQNVGYQPIPRNQSLVPAGFWGQGNMPTIFTGNPINTNPVIPNSSVFPSADGATYGQMLQDNPLKPILTSSNDSKTIMVTSVLNPKTGKYDVKVGDKVVHSFGSKKLAEEYAKRKGPDLLRDVAPLGDITKGTHPNTNLIQTDKLDDFGNRFNNIDDHLGRLDSRVDGIYQNVDKLKRGVGEANGKIIGKIDDVAHNVTGLTDKVDDVAQNVGKLKRGLGEVSGKLIGKIDEQGKAIGDLANKTDDIAQNVGKLKTGLGEGLGKVIAKVDDQGKAIGTLTDKVDDIAKQMSKQNGKMALIAGAAVVLAGVAGYLLGKSADKDKADVADGITKAGEAAGNVVADNATKTGATNQSPEVTVVAPQNGNETNITEPNPIAAQAEPDTPLAAVDEPEIIIDPNSPIDADGRATVQDGDGLCRIARRYLKYKFKNEPDKFKNLSTEEQEKLVWQVVDKIKELNGFELVEKVINGKKVLVTKEMIHPGQKIQVVEKLDKVA